MKRFLGWLNVAVLLFAVPVYAATSTIIYADSFDTVGTTTTPVPHLGSPNLLGDSHVDVEIDQDWTDNNSEVAFFHFPYPSQQIDGQNVRFYLKYETSDNAANNECIRVTLCAARDGGSWKGNNLLPKLDLIDFLVTPGDNFNNRLGSVVSGAAAISICGTLNEPCTQGICGAATPATVRGSIYRLNSLPGCVDGSTAPIRINSIQILHNQ